MKIVLRSLLFLFATSCLTWADGIPYNRETGKVEAPHTMIELSKDQQQELETLRTVTLNAEQWQALRKVSPVTPKRLTQVLFTDYEDCACGLYAYAIALNSSKIAVIHGAVDAEPLSWQIWSMSRVDLTVDRRGQFYFEGTLVPFETLRQIFGAKPEHQASESERHLFVHLPLGVKRSDSVVKERIDRLYAAANKAKWITSDR